MTAVCTLLLLWSCGHEHHDGHDHAHEAAIHEEMHGKDAHEEEIREEDAHAHSDEIVISPEKAAAAGIATEKVRPGTFSGIIRTGGQILPAPGDEKIIPASTDGIVAFGRSYFEGTRVRKGEPLFSILSGNIQDGNRVGKAKIAYETAASEYERAAKLVDDKIISRKEFIQIKENYENARMAYEALKPNADGTGASVEAPADGHIRGIFVNEGDFVTTGTPLASMVGGDKFILKADVSQRYYGLLDEIHSANFLPQYGDQAIDIKSLGGKLAAVGKSSAGNAPYIPVTFEFQSTGGIVPWSFAEIWLQTTPRENVISIPVSALTEEQGLYFVYLKMDESCYRKQEVTLGESDGMRTEILTGLKEGDEVVVRGAYNVKLASASNIIPAHTHNH